MSPARMPKIDCKALGLILNNILNELLTVIFQTIRMFIFLFEMGSLMSSWKSKLSFQPLTLSQFSSLFGDGSVASLVGTFCECQLYKN